MSDTEEAVDLTSRAFGLNKKQQAVFIRIIWVLAVTGHIAWVCGWLSPFRISPPFVYLDDANRGMQEERDRRVKDRQELEGALGDVRKNANAGLGIVVNRELREEMVAFCFAKQAERDAMREYIDYLEALYRTLHSRDYPEPACAQGRNRS